MSDTPKPPALEVARYCCELVNDGYGEQIATMVRDSLGGYIWYDDVRTLIDRERDAARREAIEECARAVETQYRREGHALHVEDEAHNAYGIRGRVRQRDAAYIRSLRSLLAPHTPPAPLTGEALEALRAEMAQDIADDEKEADRG